MFDTISVDRGFHTFPFEIYLEIRVVHCFVSEIGLLCVPMSYKSIDSIIKG